MVVCEVGHGLAFVPETELLCVGLVSEYAQFRPSEVLQFLNKSRTHMAQGLINVEKEYTGYVRLWEENGRGAKEARRSEEWVRSRRQRRSGERSSKC